MMKFSIFFWALVVSCACSTNIKVEEIPDTKSESNSTSTAKGPQTVIPCPPISGILSVIIVDKEYSDRLNPKSKCYWGDEFTNGINLFVMYHGERLLHKYLFSLQNPNIAPFAKEEYLANYSTIIPSNCGTLGYCFIPCGDGEECIDENGETVFYNWIYYPDGSEDEIRLKIGGGNPAGTWYLDKLWINGDLALQRYNKDVIIESLSTQESPFIYNQAYFNPKYYPWMKPVLTDKGEVMGVTAEGYRNEVVIVK